MRDCYRSLMRAEQPAFEQRSNTMHPWHGNVCRIAAAGYVGHSVTISLFGKGTIYLTFLTPMDCGFSLWATATDCGWEVKYIDPFGKAVIPFPAVGVNL